MRRPDPLPQRPRVEPVFVEPSEPAIDEARADDVISKPTKATSSRHAEVVTADEDAEAGEDAIPTAVITPMRRPKASTKRLAEASDDDGDADGDDAGVAPDDAPDDDDL